MNRQLNEHLHVKRFKTQQLLDELTSDAALDGNDQCADRIHTLEMTKTRDMLVFIDETLDLIY